MSSLSNDPRVINSELPHPTEGLETSESSGDALNSQPEKRTSRYQKLYKFFGFTQAYNLPLWAIFAGSILAFSLFRLQDYSYDAMFAYQITPGFMYYFSSGSYRVGMILHLAGALPAGLLMGLQFVPAVRHKFILFHRINGYFVLVLLLASNVGASIVLRHNDSGTRVPIQAAEVILVILTTISMGLAYWNIKRLQIDQHRAWMLRAMFLFGAIVTSRIIDFIGSIIVGYAGAYYTIWSCDQIDFTYKQLGVSDILKLRYPQCLVPNGTLDGMVVVKANRNAIFSGFGAESIGVAGSGPENIGASESIPFGAALWIAIILHLIGVELYLGLTPRESGRLRQVSYERQLAAGYGNPSNSAAAVNRVESVEERRPKNDEV